MTKVVSAGLTAESVAAGLVAIGVLPGSRVAVMMSGTDAEIAESAVALAGCEPVRIPEHANGVRLSFRLRGVCAALVAGREQSSAVGQVAGDLPQLDHLWQVPAGFAELAAAAAGNYPVAFAN